MATFYPEQRLCAVHTIHLTRAVPANKVRADNLRSRCQGERAEPDRAEGAGANPKGIGGGTTRQPLSLRLHSDPMQDGQLRRQQGRQRWQSQRT
jgi:hypothetical protein